MTVRFSPKTAGLALLAAPTAGYLACLAVYARNIPKGDDYWPVLRFLCDWTRAATWLDRWHLIVAPFWDNRVLLPKFLALLEYDSLGRCSFLLFQVAGWVGWVALAAALAGGIPAVRRSPWLALPAFLVLMQPQGSGTLTMALGALSCVTVLVLAFVALRYAAAPGPPRFGLALVCGVLAPLALINGLVLFPVAIVRLLWLRRWRRAGLFAVAALATWAAYFLGYSYPLHRLALGECIANACVMAGSLTALGRMPLGVVGLAGCLIAAGAAALLLWPRTWRAAADHAAYLAFLLLSIGACARGRVGWGPDYMIQDRYRLYSLLTVATGWLILVEILPGFRRRAWCGAGVSFGLLFAALSYVMILPDLATSRLWSTMTAANGQLGVPFPLVDTNGWPEASETLGAARDLGVYRLPQPLSTADLAVIRGLDARGAGVEFRAEANGGVSGFVLAAVPGSTTPAATEFGAIRTSRGWMLLPREVLRQPAGQILRHRSIYQGDARFILPGAVAEAGRHAFYGLTRSPAGLLQASWVATADVPANPAHPSSP